ncbi:hypothetical protein OZ401_004612 (plasmid) [Candidatus Chlorohelix allophototropha]|uniref:Uncharacterized protein n=1 Tax=Candidatus Chlorohelix allophototropha TaxID=3003348 RepID=A0ABY9BAA0_9CHLR|nr:hypothetical protein OZ401_004612 [Chloroflexota bacterium L227-S17]
MNMRRRLRGFGILTVLVLVLSIAYSPLTSTLAAESSRFFPETGHTVSGKFLDYWNNNGGLATYGYPITDAQMETDPETGKTFLTQWFERHRLELHPENAGTKYEVLAGLLGKEINRTKLTTEPGFQKATQLYDPAFSKDQQWYFTETGHNLGFGFLKYWQDNGGLERFGYPISEYRRELDPETGKTFMMQWFERARFEYHPENQKPYDILLGLLGKQIKGSNSTKIISLQSNSQFSSPETNLGLPPGVHSMLNIPFETGWSVATQNSDHPNYPTLITVEANITRAQSIFVLLQAGWALKIYEGKKIGSISLNFSSGKNVLVPLVLGMNIRDWSRNNPEAVNTISSPTVREGWRGVDSVGNVGGMDILTIEIPAEYNSATITTIQVLDESFTEAGSINPCIHLLAITAKYLS